MLARRLLLLAAALMLLTALAAGLASEPRDTDAPIPERTVGAPVSIVEEHLSATESDQSITAKVGDLVRFDVTGDLLDQVQIERLDRIDPIEPNTPARFEVIPEAPGVYPIRLIEADRRIGRLDISP